MTLPKYLVRFQIPMSFIWQSLLNQKGHGGSLHKPGRIGLSPARPPPFVGSYTHVRHQNAKVCSTDACKSFADSVLNARAKNYTDVDPCTDFATYTCANWWDTHEYRSDQSSKCPARHLGFRRSLSYLHVKASFD
jgi:hypothetical protein